MCVIATVTLVGQIAAFTMTEYNSLWFRTLDDVASAQSCTYLAHMINVQQLRMNYENGTQNH